MLYIFLFLHYNKIYRMTYRTHRKLYFIEIFYNKTWLQILKLNAIIKFIKYIFRKIYAKRVLNFTNIIFWSSNNRFILLCKIYLKIFYIYDTIKYLRKNCLR